MADAAISHIGIGQKSPLVIAEIGKGNWMYIWWARRLQSSTNDIEYGADMNTYTTTSTPTRNTAAATESKLDRMVRNFLTEVRRALEIVGAAHQNGLPPL
jgi:hypothetical protein